MLLLAISLLEMQIAKPKQKCSAFPLQNTTASEDYKI